MLDLRSDHWAVRAGFALAAVWAVAFMIRTSWPDPDYFPVDFKYFWLSGKLWLAGVTPYGPEMQALGAVHFPEERINPFFYPPNWRAIVTPIALLSPSTAETLWAMLSAAAVVLASWQLAGLSALHPRTLSRFRMFAIYLFLIGALSHGSEIAIQIGQPAPLMLLAITSLLTAVANSNRSLAVVALAALLLKPHLSIPIIAAAAFVPFLRIPIIIAGGFTGLLALHGLGLEAPIENLSAFLNNIALYGAFPENWPVHISGSNFILALAGIAPLGPFTLLALCIAAAAGAALLTASKSRHRSDPETPLSLLIFASLLSVAVMSTHNFDLLAAAPAMLLWTRANSRERMLLFIGALLVMRSMSLALVTDGLFFSDKTSWVALFDTLGSFLLLYVSAARLNLSTAHTHNRMLSVKSETLGAGQC